MIGARKSDQRSGLVRTNRRRSAPNNGLRSITWAACEHFSPYSYGRRCSRRVDGSRWGVVGATWFLVSWLVSQRIIVKPALCLASNSTETTSVFEVDLLE